jgi:enolase 1/2/3
MSDAFQIARIDARRILNSHREWTIEFSVVFADGRFGRGAAPRGETPSVYERTADPRANVRAVDEARASLIGRPLTQESLDDLMLERQASWGAPAVYSLSVACFEAAAGSDHPLRTRSDAAARQRPRGVLFNFLNGGTHAYTLPVGSDFTEFLLVPRAGDIAADIDAYLGLLDMASERLSRFPIRWVGGQPVADLGPHPNETACALVHEMLAAAGLADRFGLMIDASAGDWVREGGYVLPVTGLHLDSPGLRDYWLQLIGECDISALEDPLGELDVATWRALHQARPAATVLLGDNFTSSDLEQLDAKRTSVDGVLLKPDQAGTVTRALRFGQRARQLGLQLVASHRSIETESPFLVHLAVRVEADWVKIGPFSDFSAVMRSNELLRWLRG